MENLFSGRISRFSKKTIENITKFFFENSKASYIVKLMKEHGVLLSRDGPKQCPSTIKIKPPLVFTKENADFLVDTLDKVLAEDFVSISDKIN